MKSSDAFAAAVADVIAQYLDQHPDENLFALARKAGLSYTTLRRLAQCEGVPDRRNVLPLINATLGVDAKRDFIKRFFPAIAAILDEALGDGGYNAPTMSVRERDVISSSLHNLVLRLANTVAGTSRRQIQRLAGKFGLDALADLLEQELVIEVDGKIRHYQGTGMTWNTPDELLLQIRHSLSYFDTSAIGGESAAVGYLTGSVNRQTLQQINRLLKDCLIKIAKCKDAPGGYGTIPFYLGALMNIFDHADIAEEDVHG